ncbi:PaRep2b protein [Pyrobaculum aerophilum]|uniref:PaRep2b protein n=1 Tax=Pyrobaculum aerophilum TaxID=13773 RepID=UPI0021626ADC|nr:PaRep2b protein [Pyrobaculum aerophilum]
MASVELSVKEATDKSKQLVITYQPKSAEAFDAAVKALRGAGFEEEVHLTAKMPEGSERGRAYIPRCRPASGVWKSRRQGVDWAKKALRSLEEIAKARASTTS